MIPVFQLPRGYEPRRLFFALTRAGRKWFFVGVTDDRHGYSFPALRPDDGKPLARGAGFDTREQAAVYARQKSLPAYAVWDSRKRCYAGLDGAYAVVAKERPKLQSFSFDVRTFLALTVKAESEEAARKLLRGLLECATVRIESADCDAVGELSADDGEADLVEIDGEAVE
jgi:hypothetical protein